MTFRQFVDSAVDRRRYWARSHVGWGFISSSEPNDAHRAVASLEALGVLDDVITQNVDGLHQKAGSASVLELHGSLAATVCLACGDHRTRLELHHRLAAANPGYTGMASALAPDGDADVGRLAEESFVTVDCLACGGLLKPDVVFFGENVPRERVVHAFQLLDRARSLVVLGSSLTVMSGYRFVLAARRSGMPVAIVNEGPTRGDDAAAIKVDGDLSEVLAAVAGSLVSVGRTRRSSIA